VGSIAFTPLAQGLLTRKYLSGVPQDSRAAQGKSLDPKMLAPGVIENLRNLDAIAQRRGQTLAQMALAWVLRDEGITSALIGASRASQVEDCARAVDNLAFTREELEEIDRFAREEDVNLWARSSETVM
jgi:L-glyceraldehyde 3-phosphate reductase